MAAAAPDFSDWIGRTWQSDDVVAERLVASYRATFEPHLAEVQDGAAPLGIHWCLWPEIVGLDAIGRDGHPALARNLPPVPQPRRMWAGGAVEIVAPLQIGDRMRRVSRIAEITCKQGRSGELWFVAIDHECTSPRGLAVRERQSLVYREDPKPRSESVATTVAKPADPARPVARSWSVPTTTTFLFRYSAITFNGHRIHYDLPYARDVEGYPGLVVHGPIQATLLLNLAASVEGSAFRGIDYRGVSPAIVGVPLECHAGGTGAEGRYWIVGPSGEVHMEARSLGAREG